ncbi:MAG: hypothetical protein J4F49_03650 [Rhodobacteraceae bacterium]|nr:hypothetical protein [Paracoccaceae bacterium]
MFVGSANAQQVTEVIENEFQTATEWANHPLVWTEAGLFFLILFALPVYAAWRSRSQGSETLKGLNLPAGSVRAMLALLIVGSFVNVLLFGATVLGDNTGQVFTAFGTLAGAVTGFYFAGRKSGEGGKE